MPESIRYGTSGWRRGLTSGTRGILAWLTWRVFLGAEVRLDVGFNVAQARLANLAHGGLLRHASDDAYGIWGAELARVGPLGAAPGMSRLVEVQFRTW